MAELFSDLGLDLSLINALKKEQIEVPTDIQSRSIPVINNADDVIMHSATASGKTLAYLLPVFKKIQLPSKELQVIILAPTHELAIQIQRQIERLAANSDTPVNSSLIVGGVNISRQIDNLKSKPQIVVGSPGRMLELIQKRKLKSHTVKTVIIDEADRLLDRKNIDSVNGILKTLLKERQIITASASMPQSIIETAEKMMRNAVLVKSEGKQSIPDIISHIYMKTEQRDKIELLKKIIKNINPSKAIVFVNKPGSIDNLTSKLQYNGINADSLHGTDFKKRRKKIMDDFRSGKLNILIASDIAARGLQMDGISNIFNMDIPEKPNEYLHRAGRTGRNNQKGEVLSFVSFGEMQFLENIQNELKIKIEEKIYYKSVIRDPFKK